MKRTCTQISKDDKGIWKISTGEGSFTVSKDFRPVFPSDVWDGKKAV